MSQASESGFLRAGTRLRRVEGARPAPNTVACDSYSDIMLGSRVAREAEGRDIGTVMTMFDRGDE